MKPLSRGRLIIPATLAVTVIACASTPTPTHDNNDGGGGASASSGAGGISGAGGTSGAGGGAICQPVPIADAGVLTYECKDGRMCSAPDPSAIDAGGPYQICPGTSECATLVSYDGGAMLGYC